MRHRAVALAALAFAVAAWGAAGSGAAARPLRVGLVEWAGASNDGGIGQDSYRGFVRAVRSLGLQGAVREVSPRTSVQDTVGYFVRQKYDLVVLGTVDPAIERIVDAVVTRYPHTRFLLPDVTPSQVPGRWRNVQAYGFRIEEASYLAGYLAGLVERRRPGRHVVSSVGGTREPQLEPFIVGFQAGARKADPHVATLSGYSGDFTSPPKCRTVAAGQIARGSGVVFDVAGVCGLGALQAAKDGHVWGIGVDVDESSLGPFVLTSVLKHEGRALYLELQAFARGRLGPRGFAWFGVRDQAVGLGKISPRVPAPLLRKLAAIRAAIARGDIRVPAKLN